MTARTMAEGSYHVNTQGFWFPVLLMWQWVQCGVWLWMRSRVLLILVAGQMFQGFSFLLIIVLFLNLNGVAHSLPSGQRARPGLAQFGSGSEPVGVALKGPQARWVVVAVGLPLFTSAQNLLRP